MQWSVVLCISQKHFYRSDHLRMTGIQPFKNKYSVALSMIMVFKVFPITMGLGPLTSQEHCHSLCSFQNSLYANCRSGTLCIFDRDEGTHSSVWL